MFIAIAIILILAIVGAAVAYVTVPHKKTFKWGTSKVGSAGYRALNALSQLLNKYITDYEFVVIPYPGAVASVKAFAKGEVDGCYGSDIALHELYAGTGRFKGFKPKRYPVQTFWAYPLEVGIAIRADLANQIKCWRDLNGKKIFTLPLLWDVGAILRKALDALGIKYEHQEMDINTVAQALKNGEIVATGIYTVAARTLAPWEQQMLLQVNLKILNPCPDEIKELERKGFVIAEVPTQGIFNKDVGAKTFVGVRFFYGFHTGTQYSADFVYKMLKVIEQHLDELIAVDPSFHLLRDMGFADFQALAVGANADIPVHPGLAKFLQEKGLWNPEWKVAK